MLSGAGQAMGHALGAAGRRLTEEQTAASDNEDDRFEDVLVAELETLQPSDPAVLEVRYVTAHPLARSRTAPPRPMRDRLPGRPASLTMLAPVLDERARSPAPAVVTDTVLLSDTLSSLVTRMALSASAMDHTLIGSQVEPSESVSQSDANVGDDDDISVHSLPPS